MSHNVVIVDEKLVQPDEDISKIKYRCRDCHLLGYVRAKTEVAKKFIAEIDRAHFELNGL